ncbi:MAG: L,D-transpeptidase family protein [Bacillota bacterium]
MPGKKLDAILYGALSAVVLLYLYFNVIAAAGGESAPDRLRETSSGTPSEMNNRGIKAGIDERDYIGDVSCTICGGRERASIDTYEGEWSEANKNEAEYREDASSIYTEQKEGAEKHDINPEGYHLYVDLDQMLMYVYKDGELIKTYEVSGGRASTPSPVGTWKIISKDTWGEGFGGAWLGLNVPWGLYGIHGTNEPWSIGKYNTSKGCIRMRNNEVKELYNMVPYNATVTIIYENMPFYPMRDGDVGSDVLEVERALKKLGYYNGSLDGIFGSALKKAVTKFQEDHKLYRTGVVNNSTYEKIMEKVKELDAGNLNDPDYKNSSYGFSILP